MTVRTSKATRTLPGGWSDLIPGVALSAIVAAIGYVAAPYVAKVAPIPNIVIALVVGIALNPIAVRPAVQPVPVMLAGPRDEYAGDVVPSLRHAVRAEHLMRCGPSLRQRARRVAPRLQNLPDRTGTEAPQQRGLSERFALRRWRSKLRRRPSSEVTTMRGAPKGVGLML